MSPTLISLFSIVAFLAYLQAGLFVFFKNPSVAVNRWFFVLTFTLSLWSAGLIIHNPNLEVYGGYPLFLLSIAGAIMFPLALVKYIAALTVSDSKFVHHKVILTSLIILCLFLLIFSFSHTEILGARLIKNSGMFHPMFYWLAVIYFSYLLLAVLAIIFYFIEWRYHFYSPLEKKQYVFIRNALAVSFISGVLIDVVMPQLGLIDNLNIAHLFGLVFVGFITFGVFHMQLFSLTPELAADSVVMRSHKIILFCNPSGWIFKSNPYTLGLLEMQEKELLGRSLGGFFSDPLLILQTLHHAKKHSIVNELDVKLVSKSGKFIPVRISFLFVKDSYDDLMGIIVFGQDMLETIALENEIATKKRLEKELHALRQELEILVKEKTLELSVVHKKLQNQLSERLLAEEKIKADSDEKELLIGEIHNRVKDNMEMIIALILAERNADRHATDKSKLLELAQRVKTLLLIHQNLYFSTRYSMVDFSHFVFCLVAELKQNASKDENILFFIDLQEAFLSFEIAMPLGMIVNELITNAMLHGWNYGVNSDNPAGQPSIWIHFLANDREFTLTVKDNGAGLPLGFNLSNATTNGLPLVEILAKDQIGGSFELHSNNGVMAVVKFFG